MKAIIELYWRIVVHTLFTSFILLVVTLCSLIIILMILVVPEISKVVKVSLRTLVMGEPPKDIINKDVADLIGTHTPALQLSFLQTLVRPFFK